MLKRILAFVLAFILIITVSGCGKKTSDTLVANNAVGTEEGSFAVYTSKPDTLCPIFSRNDANINMLGIVYDGLVRLNGKLAAEPRLAESWTVSGDGKKWTFTLRQNAVWHDGSNFSANDVVYTVNQIKNSEDSVYLYNVSNITDIRAKGQYTVEIDVAEPWPGFVNLMYFPIIKSGGEINRDTFKPVGTGAYKFEDRGDGNVFYLTRHDQWWGGKAATAVITVKVLPDNETALHSFSSGVLDMTTADTANWSRFVDSTTASYTSVKSTEFTFLGLNHSSGALKFPEVRKAISLSVDRSGIVTENLMGYATVAKHPIHPEWAICGEKTFDASQDIGAARSVLEDNGWKAVGNVYNKTVDEIAYGTEFRILYNEDNEVREAIATEVKSNLEEAGMRATVEKVTYDDYTLRIAEGNYDIFIGSCVISPDLNFSFVTGTGNMFGFEDEGMMAAIDSAKFKNPSDLAGAYAPIIAKFEELNPIVGLYFKDRILVHSNLLQGEIKASCFDMYHGIESLTKGVAE